MKIHLTNLNNKTRKGLYLYIKDNKKPARYYKTTTDQYIDPYIQYYKDKYTRKKTKGTLTQYIQLYNQTITTTQRPKKIPPTLKRTHTNYLKKLKKQGTINQQLHTGQQKQTIQNIYKTTDKQIHQTTQQLLQPLVLDQQILNILNTEENLKKIKTRFFYNINFNGHNQRTLAKTTASNQTPKEIIQKLKQIKNQKIDTTETPKNKQLNAFLTLNGIQPLEPQENGQITSIQLTITFTKGK